MNPSGGSGEAGTPALRADDSIEKRVEALSSWMRHIDLQLRATATAVDEKALKELRRTIEALAKRDPRFEDRVTNRVDVVADRLASLAKTVSTTATTLAAKDGEIAALRRELHQGNARLEAVMAELRRTIDAAKVDARSRPAAAPSDEKKPKGLDQRLDALGKKVDVLAQRLDTLAGTVGVTAAGLAGHEGELAALRRKRDDDTSSVEGAIEELRRAIDPLPVLELRQAVKTLSDQTAALKRSNRRGLDEATSRATALAAHLDSLAKTVGGTSAAVADREREIGALRAVFDKENTRLDSLVAKLHQGMATLTSQVASLEHTARAAETEEQRAWTRDQIGTLAQRLDAIDALEHEREATAYELATLSSTIDVLVGRVDELGSQVEATSSDYGRKQAEVVALTRRFQEASSRVDVLVGDLRKALEMMPRKGVDADVETRLDDLTQFVESFASRLTRVEADSAMPTDASATASELASLRARLDEAVSGMASSEHELAAMAGSRDLAARLDELTARLDALEQADLAFAPAEPSLPLLGEGRFRLELRALELRIEHAEAASRENREAVLMQLERLASRIEWRFQELEAAGGAPVLRQAGGTRPIGQVVPIRGDD